MDIQINTLSETVKVKQCPSCRGTGKVKAMQSVITPIGSARGSDTIIKCKKCEGIGVVIK